jgi:hypothetical protein
MPQAAGIPSSDSIPETVAAEANAIKRLTGMRIAVPHAIALIGMRDF